MLHASFPLKKSLGVFRALRVGESRVSVPHPQYLGQGRPTREQQIKKVEGFGLHLQGTGQCGGQQDQGDFIEQHVSTAVRPQEMVANRNNDDTVKKH